MRVLQGTANLVMAQVIGSEPYEVALKVEHGFLYVDCTCPYFGGTGPCKHIWATLRKADRQGYLLTVKAAGWMPLTDDLGWFDSAGDLDGDDFDDENEDEDDDPYVYTQARPTPTRPEAAPPPPPQPLWRKRLLSVGRPPESPFPSAANVWPAGRQILYILNLNETARDGDLVIDLAVRDAKGESGWSSPKQAQIRIDAVTALPDAADREILAAVTNSVIESAHYYYSYRSPRTMLPNHFHLADPLASVAIPAIARSGRFFVRAGSAPPEPLVWSDEPWAPHFQLEEAEKEWHLTVSLRQNGEITPLSSCRALSTSGWAIVNNSIGRFSHTEALPLIAEIASHGPIPIPPDDVQQFLADFLADPRVPSFETPESLRYEEVQGEPSPLLRIEPIGSGGNRRLGASLWFDYGDLLIPDQSAAASRYDPETRRLIRRKLETETALASRLQAAGFRALPMYLRTESRRWEINPKKLHKAIVALVSDGWKVEAEGVAYRQAGEFRIEVATGIDWFDLEGSVDFGPVQATLPQLLEALRKGEGSVVLSDGSFGVIPEEWRRRLQLLATSSVAKDGSCRFQRSQAALLDALLASEPAARLDEDFLRIRERLQRFEGIAPAAQPEGFQGLLRQYQKEGLAWLNFLREFGFGGCLADDMGVGKTIQVLALLEARRALYGDGSNGGGAERKPSLVVAPRSLIFNWMEEARRFTPELRVLDYTGTGRNRDAIPEHDLALTTYGTVRRDILHLKSIPFDCVILDEAQAIKNSRTDSAKTARLLKADHRLALTGTPVENHLGELWSIFEFLNPGMLGASSLWQSTKGVVRNPSPETRNVLRRALRPYILRRTKAQVAPELPPKSEQTVFCELDARQRKLYNELRDFYRNSLLDRIQSEGLAKSKIQVLEALLRLRQAACHPALLDRQHAVQESAKFEALMPMLEEVLDGDNKALVFSQFTSLLALLQRHLEQRSWTFEYLDGQTRDRQACVDRFQSDENCKLFLISLKAGGLGLNLTAAGYVFLLDPWWNPAVEAQAIDRAHRIGQSQQVFAYRLIAKDTVEEKVLALQNTKRELADAIISEDNSVLRALTREDVALLLS